MICNRSLCPFSAKNVRFVHGLLILSIMLDKIIKTILEKDNKRKNDQ